jgi:hypothetical protein
VQGKGRQYKFITFVLGQGDRQLIGIYANDLVPKLPKMADNTRCSG